MRPSLSAQENDQPKRARMRGKLVGGLFIRTKGHTRRCFCVECLNLRATRASEKRGWRR